MSKTIADYSAAVSIDASNDYLLIEPSGNTVYNKINRNTLLGLSSAPLGTTDSQSPTNKTFDNTNSFTVKDGNLTLQNSASTTKQAVFSLASITAGQTRTITVPDSNLTLVGTATTQTLTNKTLTSPTITGGTIDNSTITVDSIAGHTTSTVVTVANMQVSNGVINTANAVTATSIAAGAVQPQALVSGTGSGWALQSFTPTWTNLTVGNAVQASKYIQIGKTVFARYDITLGNTSSISGSVTATLPITAVSHGTSSIFGYGLAINTGVAEYNLTVEFQSTTSVVFYANNSAGTYSTMAALSSTVPFTWGNGSRLSAWVTYEAA